MLYMYIRFHAYPSPLCSLVHKYSWTLLILLLCPPCISQHFLLFQPPISFSPLPYLRQLVLPDISSVARIRRWLDIMMHCLRLQTTKLRDFSLDMGLVMTPLSAANTGKDHLTHCAHNLCHICCSCELYWTFVSIITVMLLTIGRTARLWHMCLHSQVCKVE